MNKKDINLISLKAKKLPEPVKISKESDIQLSKVKIHYAVYGNGERNVLLLHGNGGSNKQLSVLASYLGSFCTVYVPDSRCHGKSGDPGEISYNLMADDMAEFIDVLNIEKPYIMGHSDGGIIAVVMAFSYPELLSGIIPCGANSKPSGLKSYFRFAIKIADAIRPDRLSKLMLTLPDFTTQDLSKIKSPAYIVAGEHDLIKLSDTLYLHNSIKNSKLAIIKGGTHSSYITENGKKGYVLAKMCIDEFERKR